MSTRHSTRWFIGGLIAIGASLLAAPIGPSISSFDRVASFATTDSFSAGAEPNDGSIDPLLASADSPRFDEGRIDGTGSELEIGLAALEQLEYPWMEMLPSWTVEFTGPRDELFGLTHTREERIEIFVRPDQTAEEVAHVVAHELGHAVDVTLNNGDDRRAWQQARDLDEHVWWPGSGTTDFATGAGDFAESFAAWQVGDDGFRSEIGDAPTPAQLELMTDLANDR